MNPLQSNLLDFLPLIREHHTRYISELARHSNEETTSQRENPRTDHENVTLYNLALKVNSRQALMASGTLGLPKFSPGPAMPDPSMPCRRATPETGFVRFRGGPLAGQTVYGSLLPPWIPQVVWAWIPGLRRWSVGLAIDA
jgi:hypothetical protein